MPFPPVAGQARASRRRSTRFVVDGTVALFKIVYNIVFNIIIVIEDVAGRLEIAPVHPMGTTWPQSRSSR
jgi:hypothetical protein